jgi:hypothetical protein
MLGSTLAGLDFLVNFCIQSSKTRENNSQFQRNMINLGYIRILLGIDPLPIARPLDRSSVPKLGRLPGAEMLAPGMPGARFEMRRRRQTHCHAFSTPAKSSSSAVADVANHHDLARAGRVTRDLEFSFQSEARIR